MAKLTLTRTVAFAGVAAVAVGFATPAFTMPYDRGGAATGDYIHAPLDSPCVTVEGHPRPAWCGIAQY